MDLRSVHGDDRDPGLARWPAAHVADQLGVSRATAYKWLRRHRTEGDAGLLDRSVAAPTFTAPTELGHEEAEILADQVGLAEDLIASAHSWDGRPRPSTGSLPGMAGVACATPTG